MCRPKCPWDLPGSYSGDSLVYLFTSDYFCWKLPASSALPFPSETQWRMWDEAEALILQLSVIWCLNFVDVCIPSFAEWRRGLGRRGGFVDGCLCCELDPVCETPGFQAKSAFSGDRLWHLEIQAKLNLIRGFHSQSVGCVAYSRSWKTIGFLWPDCLNLIYWEIWEAEHQRHCRKLKKISLHIPVDLLAQWMSRASGVCDQLS